MQKGLRWVEQSRVEGRVCFRRTEHTHLMTLRALLLNLQGNRELSTTSQLRSILFQVTSYNIREIKLLFLLCCQQSRRLSHQKSIPATPLIVSYKKYFRKVNSSRSQWPNGLRRGSTDDRLLGSRVRILSGHGYLSVFNVVSVVRKRSLQRADHSSTGVQPTVVCPCV